MACFIAGIFDTMVDYMSRDEFKNLAAWQTKFLYPEAKTSGSRDQFWDAVLTRALKILSDKSELYKTWLDDSEA